MRFLDAWRKGFNEERKKAHLEAEENRQRLSKVIKVVTPSYGTVVTLQIMAEEPDRHMYVEQLEMLADVADAEVTVEGQKVTINFQDAATAESVRQYWK